MRYISDPETKLKASHAAVVCNFVTMLQTAYIHWLDDGGREPVDEWDKVYWWVYGELEDEVRQDLWEKVWENKMTTTAMRRNVPRDSLRFNYRAIHDDEDGSGDEGNIVFFPYWMGMAKSAKRELDSQAREMVGKVLTSAEAEVELTPRGSRPTHPSGGAASASAAAPPPAPRPSVAPSSSASAAAPPPPPSKSRKIADLLQDMASSSTGPIVDPAAGSASGAYVGPSDPSGSSKRPPSQSPSGASTPPSEEKKHKGGVKGGASILLNRTG
jgi:hypothetical protein